MAVLDALRRLVGQKAADPPGMPEPIFNPIAYTWYYDQILGMGESEMWRTQPQLRTVVSFLARNVAQLGLQTFARQSDNDRVRLVNAQSALLLAKPNPEQTGYELVYNLVADLALYDKAYWYVTHSTRMESSWEITRIPPTWVIGLDPDGLYGLKEFIIQPTTGQSSMQTRIPASKIIYFHGWNPDDPKLGDSPVVALRETLAEQMAAQEFRNQNWRNGGRLNGVIERPDTAPDWSDQAKRKFKKGWKDAYSGRYGSDAGGVPILEEGMTYKPVGFSAADNQFVETAKLSLGTVCGVYHVNPIMVGDNAGANYSNVKEFRKALYGDTLGPTCAQIEARVNGVLLPLIGEPRQNYVEFNINEKLQGNFEDQAMALQMAVGGPWMTRAEARAMNNMPFVAGSDQLVVPLNVLTGGQASPRDSAPAPGDRTGPGDSQPEQQPKDVSLAAFLARQRRVITSKLGADPDVDRAWNDDRWDQELSWFMPCAGNFNAITKAALREALTDGYDADRVAAAFDRALSLPA